MSELFDFSIYVDADTEHIAKWYVDRFLALRRGAFANPSSFFNVFAHLTDDEAVQTAMGYWNDINLPNLVENVLPTKHQARLILEKGADAHRRTGAAAQTVTRRSLIGPVCGRAISCARFGHDPSPGVVDLRLRRRSSRSRRTTRG